MNKKEILKKKIDYIVGGATKEDYNKIKFIREGHNKELLKIFKNAKNRFLSVGEVLTKYSSLDKLTDEKLNSVAKDIAVEVMSVDSGYKFLIKFKRLSRTAKIKYLYNLYLRDEYRRSRYVKSWDANPILVEPQTTMDISDSSERIYFQYNNPLQDSPKPTGVDTYDEEGSYLNKEFKTRPTINKQYIKKIRERLKKFIKFPVQDDGDSPTHPGGKT